MNPDVYYYIDWWKNDWKYRLTFIIGSPDLIDTDYINAIKLPPNVILEDVKVDVKYENDLPIGLPITSELTIKWDLTNLFDDDYNTWTDFKNWLIQGSIYTINQLNADETKRKYKNVVILAHNNGDGTEETNTEIFIGVQDIKPEKEFEVSSTQVLEQITYISIDRAVLEKIEWTDFTTGFNVYTEQYRPYENRKKYNLPGIVENHYPATIYYKNQNNQNIYIDDDIPFVGPVVWTDTRYHAIGFSGEEKTVINFQSFTNFFQSLRTLSEVWFNMYLRIDNGQFVLGADIFNHINFHYRSYSNIGEYQGNTGTGYPFTNNPNILHFIQEVYNSDDTTKSVAGFLNDNDKNQTCYKYQTPYDLLKQWADGYLCKIKLTYTQNSISFTFLPIFYYENSTIKEITKYDILNDLKPITGFNQIQKATREYSGSIGENDLKVVETVQYGAEQDKSDEGVLPFHNALINYDYLNEKIITKDLFDRVMYKTLPTFTNLYYKGTVKNNRGKDVTAWLPIHDLINIYYNNTLSVTSSNYTVNPPTQLPAMYYEKFIKTDQVKVTTERKNNLLRTGEKQATNTDIAFELQGWIDSRYNNSGMGKLINKLALQVLNKPRQAIIPIQVTTDKVRIENLSDKYELDLSSLLPYNFQLGVETSDAFLTACTMDCINNKADVKFFITGF